MLQRSTIQLLRFKFSYFLMPVYWFALSFVQQVEVWRAVLIFVILHLLVYPSSNGYNSYMDRDETSIGGLQKPLQPTKELFYTTVMMDVVAIAFSLMVSLLFAFCVAVYIGFSRLYSYRGIRLKQYAVIGYLTVIVNQGALVFFIVCYGSSVTLNTHIAWQGIVAAAFLIGGFYPITQVYQHKEDKADGVETISMLLGKKGTFIFCGIMYAIAFGILFFYFETKQQLRSFVVLQLFFIPVIAYFFYWLIKVWRDECIADFKHTMRMNWIAGSCTSLAFITLLILNRI